MDLKGKNFRAVIGPHAKYTEAYHDAMYFAVDKNSIFVNGVEYGAKVNPNDLDSVKDVAYDATKNTITITYTKAGKASKTITLNSYVKDIKSGSAAITTTFTPEKVASVELLIDPADNLLSQVDAKGLKSEISLTYSAGTVQLKGKAGKVISSINLGEHQLLESATLVTEAGKKYIVLKFKGASEPMKIDVSALVDTYYVDNSSIIGKGTKEDPFKVDWAKAPKQKWEVLE